VTPDAVSKALPVLGTVGIVGLFLPSIETAWQARPGEPDAGRVRRGEQVYLGASVVIGLLAAYGQRSATPLVLCTGLGLLLVAVYEHALRTPPAAQRTIG
jgi:hypothetical protein